MGRATAPQSVLLDFGSMVAIEFAEYGNACYLYSEKAAAKVLLTFGQAGR